MVLITLVQRVVRAFDKGPGPFDQPGREQSGERTEEDLLHKRCLHPVFQSRGDARDSLPKAPLLGFHNPKAEKKISEGMGEDAGGEALSAVGNPVIDCAGQ